MKSLSFSLFALLVAVAVFGSGCKAKLCDPSPTPPGKHLQKLGVVVPEARFCKDRRLVASFDFPKHSPKQATDMLQASLKKAGWKISYASNKRIFAKRPKNNSLLIIAGKSRKRRVTFALVRYCPHDAARCNKRLGDLGKALGKYNK